MKVEELPLVFECEGSELLGVLHRPESPRGTGVLSIVAGGPQYRAGVCRMQVQLARRLAAEGYPVLRFDYRGLGDSEGEFRGFTDVEADLRAALQAYRREMPALGQFVLWGGCDAASAALINAWKFPEVTGLVLGNPWAHSTETSDAVAVQHYSRRLRDKDFWIKLIKLQYNPLPAAWTVVRRALSALVPSRRPASAPVATDDPAMPFILRMRNGMSRFRGDVLLLMSGRSLVSREFDVLVAADPQWQAALRSPRRVVRHELPDADQAFSQVAARAEVAEATCRWLQDPTSVGAAAPAR